MVSVMAHPSIMLVRRVLAASGWRAMPSSAVLTALHGQSPDIAMGVDSAMENREGGTDAYFIDDHGNEKGYAHFEPRPIGGELF